MLPSSAGDLTILTAAERAALRDGAPVVKRYRYVNLIGATADDVRTAPEAPCQPSGDSKRVDEPGRRASVEFCESKSPMRNGNLLRGLFQHHFDHYCPINICEVWL